MKLYRLYFKDKENEEKYYIQALTFGGDPFVSIIPAFLEGEEGIYEEDKANAYVKMLQEQTKDKNIPIEYGKEEVKNGR